MAHGPRPLGVTMSARTVLALGLSLALFLTGCSDRTTDRRSEAAASPSASASPEPTPEPTVAPKPTRTT
ncbi:polysaccharide deacetylase family protein, partial [Micromonospora sp. KC207]